MNGIDGEDGEPGPPGPAGSTGPAGAGLNSHYVITLPDASLPNAIVHPQEANFFADTPATSPNAMDDEFNDTSGNSGTVNGINARWTNTNTAVLTYAPQGWVKLTGAAHSGHQIRGILQSLPGDGTYDMKVSFQSNNAVVFVGMWLKDLINGDSYAYGIVTAIGPPVTFTLFVTKYASDTGGVTNVRNTTAASGAFVMERLYLRFVKAGTTFTWYHSMDGIAWTMFHTETDAIVPTAIGLMYDEQSNLTGNAVFVDWFRKTA